MFMYWRVCTYVLESQSTSLWIHLYMGSGDQTQVTKLVWCHLTGHKTVFRSFNSKTSVVLVDFILFVYSNNIY